MRIAIDCRFWGPSHTGLGVYTQQLVENLAKIDKENHYFLLLRPEAISVITLPENFQKIEVDAPAYSIKEQLMLPLVLYRINPDLVHFASINIPVFYLGRYIITVHDLIKHASRGVATSTHNPLFYWLKYAVYLLVSWWAVHLSRKIIVPSATVKDQLRESYNLNPDKIVITHEAATISGQGRKKELPLPQKFAIYVGNAYPHKNLANLIKAWKDVYKTTKTKLIIVCGRSVFVRRFEQLLEKEQAQEYVSFVGYLNDEQLRFAYGRASVYVFPTLMEGFGIPGLDAMNLGLPVVCSDIPVLHEIYGPAARYFDPLNPAAIAQKVTEVLRDKKIRAKLIVAGKARSAKYSWPKLARETLNTYYSV